eukprot:CAMPEP_0178932720 /NCGR_PEP_ID=MMETSP0786-20121207/22800_1 /TAXON_ID=186022 /ORGANISM="Thalassionema frauenfeldii, Strain CCMP 1798" /LENGTH=503 /DNA_ID=CAMNT_0020610095 /DNA_START=37 /DNA_END=1548 /DNA_ORIENTATION=-
MVSNDEAQSAGQSEGVAVDATESRQANSVAKLGQRLFYRRAVVVCLIFFSVFLIVNDFQKFEYYVAKDGNIAKSIMQAISTTDDSIDDHQVQSIQEQRHQAENLTIEEQPVRIAYRAMAGIGHQLARMASVYALAKNYNIPNIHITINPMCGGTISTIYDHLFGPGPIIVNLDTKMTQLPRILPKLKMDLTNLTSVQRNANINNEVPNFKAHNPLAVAQYAEDIELYSYELYQQLMLLFQHKHKDRIQQMYERLNFHNQTVFALHVRGGNGEKRSFKVHHRGFQIDENRWIRNVIKLLCNYSRNHDHYFKKKPLMIFVGTDTGSIVTRLQNASKSMCEVPVVSIPQEYPDEGKGVSFQVFTGSKKDVSKNEKCLKSYEDMLLDMYFFTLSNTVIPGMYSSFTQTAPLFHILHKAKSSKMDEVDPDHHPHYFCDVGNAGDRMKCFNTLRSWALNRDEKFSYGNTTSPSQSPRLVEIQSPNINGADMGSHIKYVFKDTALKEIKQ